MITWIRRLRIWLNNCSTWTVQYGSQDWYKGYKGIHFRDSPIPTPSQHWGGSNKMAPIVKCVLLCCLFVTGRWKKCNIQFQFMTYVCMQLNIYCLRSASHIIYRVFKIEVIFCQQHYFFIKWKPPITIVFWMC